MLGLSNLAKQHRQIFYNLLFEVGKDIVIRKEPPATSVGATNVNRALGTRATQSTSYPEVTVKAIVSGPTSLPLKAGSPSDLDAVGRLQTSEIVLRVKLADVLVDAANVYGETLFDIAHDVMIDGTRFKVDGVERSGLPPLSPYICWVGLSSEGKE